MNNNASQQQILSTFYCFCSEASYVEILDKQKSNPLEFTEFLNEHTKCTLGCGSCIENLREYLTATGNFIEQEVRNVIS